MARMPRDPTGAWLAVRGRRPGSPRYGSTGQWIPVAGRRPGSSRFFETGQWIPVAGRPPGSKAVGLGRDDRGRFARVRLGPEAHYEWSLDRGLTYFANGVYRYRGRSIGGERVRELLTAGQVDLGPEAHYEWSADRTLASWPDGSYTIGGAVASAAAVRAILEASKRDLGQEAHWLWHERPPTIRYFKSGLYTIDGRNATAGAAQRAMMEQLRQRADAVLPGWHSQDLEPDAAEAELERHTDFETGTDPMKLEDIVMSYGFDEEERRGDVEEDRDVPLDNPIDDGTEELDRAWKLFELPLVDLPVGLWSSERIGLLISYYLVAHKVVYEDEAKFGEAIVTRFAPIGREAMVELRWRVREMLEKSEDDVTFVAAGFRLRAYLLQ